VTGLRRYARQVLSATDALPAEPAARRCELCGAELDDRHRHVVALDDRAVRCVCRACGLLFAPAGAGGGRIRAVPERHVTDPAHPIAERDWHLLGLPALPVFLFRNSDLDQVVACYPSPAGTTESIVDRDAWAELEPAYPLLRMPDPDVEAVFVIRADAGLEAYLVPIDECFALAGQVRLGWRGPDGGPAVRQAMAAFVQRVQANSRPLDSTRIG
jgi:hypothetical protein